jgi:hypothetical protein
MPLWQPVSSLTNTSSLHVLLSYSTTITHQFQYN